MILFALASLIVILATSALLFAGVRVLGWLQLRDRGLVTAVVGIAYALVLRLEPSWWLACDAAVVAMALVAGIMIGSTLRSGPAVIAFCVAAALVDVLSFSGGLTRTIVDSYQSGDNRVLMYLSITAPVGGSIRPIVGIGDLIILAGLFAGFNHLRDRGWMPFAVPVGGLVLALGVGLAVGGVPALPFIAAITVVYVLWRRKLRPVTVPPAH
jgi:hypothetical protein